MKFKYEYPAYINLQQKNYLSFEMDDALLQHFGAEKTLSLISRAFDTFSATNQNERYYITDSFKDAIEKSLPKLKDLLDKGLDFSADIFTEPRIFMHRNGFAMHRIEQHEGVKYLHLCIFSKDALVGYGAVDFESAFGQDKAKKFKSFGFLATKEVGSGVDIYYEFWMSYIYLLVFLKECEIETIVVQPEKKLKYESKKYFNDLKTPIRFLDCRWFRELVINTPFGVSGHFRWQPCGEGLKKRKLIWIEAYEKKGYHRKAQVETLNPNV